MPVPSKIVETYENQQTHLKEFNILLETLGA